ncbi:MAG: DUF6526 family protein [Pyrinomonadaceae bacterium]
MPKEQTYKNYVRWYPLVHFVIAPLLVLNLIYHAVRFYQGPGTDRFVLLILGAVFILMNIAARLQALKAQDRVIRLEERLRYTKLLPPELASKAAEFPISTIVALRFASDEELSATVSEVLAGRLTSSKDIKAAIKNWRGDYLRV